MTFTVALNVPVSAEFDIIDVRMSVYSPVRAATVSRLPGPISTEIFLSDSLAAGTFSMCSLVSLVVSSSLSETVVSTPTSTGSATGT